jgi:hypothetical protein
MFRNKVLDQETNHLHVKNRSVAIAVFGIAFAAGLFFLFSSSSVEVSMDCEIPSDISTLGPFRDFCMRRDRLRYFEVEPRTVFPVKSALLFDEESLPPKRVIVRVIGGPGASAFGIGKSNYDQWVHSTITTCEAILLQPAYAGTFSNIPTVGAFETRARVEIRSLT